MGSAEAVRIVALAERLVGTAYALRVAVPVLKHIRRFVHPEEFAPLVRPFLKCGDPQGNGVRQRCAALRESNSRGPRLSRLSSLPIPPRG